MEIESIQQQANQAKHTLKQATLWKNASTVQAHIQQLAIELKAYAQTLSTPPLFLSILGGQLYFANALLPMLHDLCLRHDFMQIIPHETQGRLDWRVIPQTPITQQHIIILDELLDDGKTIATIVDRLNEWDVQSIKVAVLCNKTNAKKAYTADYVCFESPENQHIFGCGMSVNGFWPHLPNVYLV